MNILITGGSGFIGKRLVKELSKNNIIWLISRKSKTNLNEKILNYITRYQFDIFKWNC